MVPEGYIPKKAKVVNPDITDDEIRQLPLPFGKTKGKVTGANSDLREREVYECLRTHFAHQQDIVLVIHGLDMFKIGEDRVRDIQEIDFLIINYSRQYIMDLEVKTWIGPIKDRQGNDKPDKNVTIKSKRQLNAIRTLFHDWFRADVKGQQWKYISALYCTGMEQKLQDCQTCFPFISQGAEDLHNKLNAIEAKLPKQLADEMIPEDLVMLCKYLLYCCPKKPLPVKGNMVTAVQKAIQEAGSADNIKVWCFPTPQQRLILEKPKVVFAAPWGSGKTLLMTAKAIELADSGEKVLYLLFNDAEATSNPSTLLFYDLQQKFQDHDRITVKSILFHDKTNNNLLDIAKDHQHVMVDEFFADFDRLSDQSQKEFKDMISTKSTV